MKQGELIHQDDLYAMRPKLNTLPSEDYRYIINTLATKDYKRYEGISQVIL